MPIIEVDPETEYQKNKRLRKSDVQSLFEWAEKQPHLPKLKELQVISILVRFDYDNERAKNKIDEFYTIRAACPELFANRNPYQINMDAYLLCLLPKSTPDGRKTMLVRFMDPDPNAFVMAEKFKLLDMVFSLLLHQEGTSNGVNMLIDQTGISFGHLTKIDLGTLRKFLYYVQNVAPIMQSSMHFINPAPMLEKLLPIMKPFIKKELLNMIHVHTNIETLYEFVPKDCLLEEYGGTCGTIPKLHDTWKKNIYDNVEFFLSEEKEVADETKRIGKSSLDQIFGTDCTFKKLDID